MSRAYEAIAAKLLAMTDDAGNWKPCWHSIGLTMPINRLTRASYRGVNVLSLWVEALERAYAVNHWATFKQWLELGQCVKKGEKGTPIAVFGTGQREDSEGEKKGYQFHRTAWVFNIAQVQPLEGGPVLDMPAVYSNPDDRLGEAERFALATNANITCSAFTAIPHFAPASDSINMPEFGSFRSAEDYYGVLMHELTHWTGAATRLNRETLVNYRAHRPMEELVAELGAAFLCADLGISLEPRADHAEYLAGWQKNLKDQPDAFMRAVSQASAAAEYLHSLQEEERAAA